MTESGAYDFARPDGIEMSIVHNSLSDERTFVHDTMLCVYNEMLYMAWYSCPSGEIVDDTRIICRNSADNGKTWSEPSVIAYDDGRYGEARHYVPVSFLVCQGELYAIVSSMTRHDRPVSTGLYKHFQNGDREAWEYVTDIISEDNDISLIVNNNALLLPNGNYII